MAWRPLVLLVAAATLSLAPPVVADRGDLDLLGDVYPTSTAPGVETALYAYVWNEWPDATSGPFDVDVLVDGALLERVRLDGVDWGGVEFTTTATFVPTGVHTLAIVVDASHEVDEADETNNALSYRYLFTHDVPDLAVEVTDVRAAGWPETRVELDVRACNVGSGPAEDARVWGWIYRPYTVPLVGLGSSGRDFHEPMGALAPGVCATRTLAHDASAWVGDAPYTLMAHSFFGDPVVFEADYANNRVDGSVAVGPHAALT